MSLRKEFGRASGSARASASMRTIFRGAATESSVSLSATAKILRCANQTEARVERHFEKHQAKWTERRYAELLKNAPATLALTPFGASRDPKERLMARARADVMLEKVMRLTRIEMAQSKMLAGGPMRKNRRIDWGKGLGE